VCVVFRAEEGVIAVGVIGWGITLFMVCVIGGGRWYLCLIYWEVHVGRVGWRLGGRID
jgi:hypothetical protein